MTVIDGFDTDQLGGQNSTDRELIDAVRRGDASAYAELYELYEHSIRSVASRLTRDRYETDDVVSEVFANTLRAIQRGGGPRDDFAVYALRSVRNTVAKLRTRTDSARALPTELTFLDQAADDDALRVAGDVELAFNSLPERFQAVLWSTAIEGQTPTDMAHGSDLDAGAVASLSNRARRALGRSYLRVHTQRPCRHPDCSRVRSNLPGYVQHMAAPATVRRIESHLRDCTDCQSVREDMMELNGKLRSTGWMALFAAAVRQLVAGFGAVNAPIVATAAAPIVALIVAGAVVNDHQESEAARATVSQAIYASSDRIESPDTTVSNSADTARPNDSASATSVVTASTVATNQGVATAEPVPADDTIDVVGPTPALPVGAAPLVIEPDGSRPGGPGAVAPTTTVAPAPSGNVPAVGGGVVSTLVATPVNVGGDVASITDGTTDALGDVVDDVVGTVGAVGTGLGTDLSPVLDPVSGIVDDTLLTVDDLVGTVGGVIDGTVGGVGGLVGSVLPGLAPTPVPTVSTTVPTVTTTTTPGLLPGLVGGLGDLLGG